MGRSLAIDKTPRRAFVFYYFFFKEKVEVSKSSSKSQGSDGNQKSAEESEQEVVLADVGEYKTTGFWVKGKCTKCVLSIS